MTITLFSGCRADITGLNALNRAFSLSDLVFISDTYATFNNSNHWVSSGLVCTFRVEFPDDTTLDPYSVNYAQVDGVGYFVLSVSRYSLHGYEFRGELDSWSYAVGKVSVRSATVIGANFLESGWVQHLPFDGVPNTEGNFIGKKTISASTSRLAFTATSEKGEKVVGVVNSSYSGAIARFFTADFFVNKSGSLPSVVKYHIDKLLLIPSSVYTKLDLTRWTAGTLKTATLTDSSEVSAHWLPFSNGTNISTVRTTFTFDLAEDNQYIVGTTVKNFSVPFRKDTTQGNTANIAFLFIFTNADIIITVGGEGGDTEVTDWFDLTPTSRDTSIQNAISKMSSVTSGVVSAVTNLSVQNYVGAGLSVAGAVSALAQPSTIVPSVSPSGASIIAGGFGVFSRRWRNANSLMWYIKKFGYAIENGFTDSLAVTATPSGDFRFIKVSSACVLGVSAPIADDFLNRLQNGVRIYSDIQKYLDGENPTSTETFLNPTYEETETISVVFPAPTLIEIPCTVEVYKDGVLDRLYTFPNSKGFTWGSTLGVPPTVNSMVYLYSGDGTLLPGGFGNYVLLSVPPIDDSKIITVSGGGVSFSATQGEVWRGRYISTEVIPVGTEYIRIDYNTTR